MIVIGCIIFISGCVFFGAQRGHYYDSDKYEGNGCAH
jgi:hypothetical protein